jgi:hypothetical protein
MKHQKIWVEEGETITNYFAMETISYHDLSLVIRAGSFNLDFGA